MSEQMRRLEAIRKEIDQTRINRADAVEQVLAPVIKDQSKVWVKLATGCQNLVPVTEDRIQKEATTNQVPTVEEIKVKLQKSPRWVRRALVVLFELQTADEQAGEHTGVTNHVGFSKFDAPGLTPLAKRVLRGDELSSSDIAYASKKLVKYAGQLHRIAEARTKEVTEFEHRQGDPIDAMNMRYEAERARVHGAVHVYMS